MPIRPLIVGDNFTVHKNYTPSQAFRSPWAPDPFYQLQS